MARLTNSNRTNGEVVCDEAIATKAILLHLWTNILYNNAKIS